MTTQNVAILFTDVVSSTELSQKVSPEEADELRRAHFSILRQALAEAGGTEVKSTGDGLMVVFDSASAALACGVAMQQGVELDNRERALAIGLRVGLSQGEVTWDGGDYFGDPVVEAARLCASCEGGQVLAAHVVRLMAGRRNRHQCRALGELHLKGLSEPVETVEVLWEPVGVADSKVSVPLPGRLAVRPTVGVVGREVETQAIADATKRIAGDQVREVLLISGEAGVGKTALVAEAARAALAGGACVLFGHCEEDLATPYQLFAEALNHYVTHTTEDHLLAYVEENGRNLDPLVPALSRRLPELPHSKATDADTERFLLFAAVVGLLARASEDQPVVLVFEDLQWADKGSLLLLQHLIAADHAMRVLIIATYRDSELSRPPSCRNPCRTAPTERSLAHRADRSRRHGSAFPHGSRRRPAYGSSRGDTGPRRSQRDGWQSVLRERGSPTPLRDRCHLPGHRWTVDGARSARTDRSARKCARGDRCPSRTPGTCR